VADSRERDERMARDVGRRAERRMRARASADRGVWFGLGMYGLVGWSIAGPTVLGVALGLWIDGRYPGGPSWTLMLLFAGLIAGCATAWYWVSKEQRAIGDDDSRPDDD
jgi:ATP synthase protein I